MNARPPDPDPRYGCQRVREPCALEVVREMIGCKVSYGACYMYSPRGRGAFSRHSRLVRARVKAADPEWLLVYATRIHDLNLQQGLFREIFCGKPVLIPVPRNVPTSRDAPWPAACLARALQGIAFSDVVWMGLLRISAVRKSATASAGDRPTVRQHFDSFAVEPAGKSPDKIVLIDDVITKGRTLLAAAMRLRTAFPDADIRAFALLRTVGRIADIAASFAPCRGEIRWSRGDARREP